MSIADRVTLQGAGPVDLAVLPTDVIDVVTLKGSIDTWPDFGAGDELIQDWMVGTLDKGTLRQDRFELADRLDNLGGQIGFSGATARVRFSARCLKKDLEVVGELLMEQLMQPALDGGELDKTRNRMQASIRRSLTDAGYRADVELARNLYPPAHPNGMILPEEEAGALDAASAEDAHRLHRHMLRAGRPRLAIVGDVDSDRCFPLVERLCAGWPESEGLAEWSPEALGAGPSHHAVDIADRDNLEVRWGHAVPLRRTDEGYIPAYMASFILGGNFSARLMDVVRDREGLTYGVGSGFRGADARYCGYWRVHVTLSRENLDRGIEVTEGVIRRFVAEGITPEELEEKKDTIAGTYQVRQATTGGLAGALLQLMEDGRPLRFLDDYPEIVRSLTPDVVNSAISSHFRSENLVRVVAGTLPDAVSLSPASQMPG